MATRSTAAASGELRETLSPLSRERRAADDLRRAEAEVLGALRRRFPGFDDAELEDCWQQAFLELWPRHGVEGRPPTGLLIVAAVRRATDHWRRYRGRHEMLDPADGAFCIADPTLDPEAIAQRELDVQRGAELLGMLPAHHQRVWRAYCDSGARGSPAAIAAIAEAEGLTPRQVTKIVEKVQEKARRIAAGGLNAELEHSPSFCKRLEDRIAAHLEGTPDPVAHRHLTSCTHCQATFGRTRRGERAAAIFAPIFWLRDHLAVAKAVVAVGAVAGGGAGVAMKLDERPTKPEPPTATITTSEPTIAPVPERATEPTSTRADAEKPKQERRPERPPSQPAVAPAPASEPELARTPSEPLAAESVPPPTRSGPPRAAVAVQKRPPRPKVDEFGLER